jgi:hypothetical protein
MKTTAFHAALALGLVASVRSAPVILPDNGGGTVNLPLAAAYQATTPMQILDGLPPGSSIQITATIPQPVLGYEQSGGSLGGTQAGYGGAMMQWSMQGTGAFSGYTRNLTFPVPAPGSVLSFTPVPATFFDTTGAPLEIHARPRTFHAPVQSFDTLVLRGQNQISGGGDPDFNLLRVTMGNDYGLNSPGHTTLTDMGGGNWNVDSFFDITYRIDFVGAPGGPFAGQSGSTTGTVRFQMGEPVSVPPVAGSGTPANVVPNPEFEIAGPDGAPVSPGTTVTTTAAAPTGPSAAAAWRQTLINGTFMTTTLLPSTNGLAGPCGHMILVTSDGVYTGSSASPLFVGLPVELPVGSEGALDIHVVSGSVTAGFAVNTASVTMLDANSASTGPTTGWTHLRFNNQTLPTGEIQIQISAPPGGTAVVYIDNVTARPPKTPRSARYDYPLAFNENWISTVLPTPRKRLPLAGDFNGDGLDDLVWFSRSEYPAEVGNVRVGLNLGAISGASAFTTSTLWQGYFGVADEIPGVGDFDGDGRDDIITFVPSSGKVWVALSGGSHFCASREWYNITTHGPFLSTGDVPLVGDFNGDGLADIAACTRGTAADVHVAINSGRSFDARTLWHGDFSAGAAVPHAGDVNGDGRDDIICFRRDTPGDYLPGLPLAGMVDVAVSTGSSFSDGSLPFWHQEFAPTTAYHPLPADLNGDGCIDILAVHQDGRVLAAVNTGHGSFATDTYGKETAFPDWQWIADVDAAADQIPVIGRFNRDLNSDLCVFRDSVDPNAVNERVFLCGDNLPDQITRVHAPAIAGPGSEITVHGLHGTNAWLRARLCGPDGTTLLLPGFVSNSGNTFTVTVPTGCYPSGLYRFLIFEDDPSGEPPASELSSASWPVTIRNTMDSWMIEHFSAWERSQTSISGDGADPDMDGYDNLAEYLLGTDPRAFNSGAVGWSKVGDNMIAAWTVRTDRGCVRMTIEESDNLADWKDLGGFDFDGTGPVGGVISGFLPYAPSVEERPRLFSRLKFARY